MEKKLMHRVILGRMEEKILQIPTSYRAEQGMYKLGEILRDSIISGKVANEIVTELKKFAKRLSKNNHEKRSRGYLEGLAKQLSPK